MMSDTICTGSHLNQRSFKEDDFWESFQSTLLSGQVMSADSSIEELSTMIEDETSEENTLNMNLDVIPDADPDDVFVDCPSFERSPANLVRQAAPAGTLRILSVRSYNRPQFYNVQFASPPDANINNSSNNINVDASPRKQRPESARRISPAQMHTTTMSIVSSSPSHEGQRTGSLLVQMAHDFDDLTDHAQSTPKLSEDSGKASSCSFAEEVTSSHDSSAVDRVRKTLDFYNADTILIEQPEKNEKHDDSEEVSQEVNQSNKENFFNGKYSRFVCLRSNSEKPSPLRTRKGKVKLLAGYFQSFANDSSQVKSLSKSRIPLPVRKSSQLMMHVKKSPQAKSRPHQSPTYQTKKSYRLVSSRSSSVSSINSKAHPKSATTFSSSGSESFLTRNQRKLPSRATRVQSCSDATNAEMVTIDETCKSFSTGDLSAGSSASIKPINDSKITMRTTTKKSPIEGLLSPGKRVSTINNRRSVGAQLKKNMSPVKPVKELCKLFTPSKTTKRATGKVTQNSLVVPKILISHA